MRQGQQNRRGRGRTGRKPQNPLARSYESNGPDVKIRGTAAHIAEKYTSLARDALASGDLVAAESYFQHAEHYNRIIMAAQSQLGPQHGGQPGEGGNGGFRPRWNADGDEDDGGPDVGRPPRGNEMRRRPRDAWRWRARPRAPCRRPGAPRRRTRALWTSWPERQRGPGARRQWQRNWWRVRRCRPVR